jgi:glutaredoxin
MYATRHCPVCKTARRWLLDNKIPYVEKDVERNQAAARELAQKAKAQGFVASGVPVFDVRGRLLPGFDPAALKAMLSGSLPPAPKPI